MQAGPKHTCQDESRPPQDRSRRIKTNQGRAASRMRPSQAGERVNLTEVGPLPRHTAQDRIPPKITQGALPRACQDLADEQLVRYRGGARPLHTEGGSGPGGWRRGVAMLACRSSHQNRGPLIAGWLRGWLRGWLMRVPDRLRRRPRDWIAADHKCMEMSRAAGGAIETRTAREDKNG